MEELKWLRKNIGKKQFLFCIAMFMAVISSALFIIYPFLSKIVTDQIIVGTLQPDGTRFHNTDILVPVLVVIIVSQLLRVFIRYGMILILESISQNVLQNLRIDIFKNLCQQDINFFSEYRTGDLMTRMTGDLDLVRHTISYISYNVVESLSLFIFSIIYFFFIDTKLTLIFIATTPFIFISSFFYAKTVYPLFAKIRQKLSVMNSTAQENISANKLVRAFVRADYENEKFDKCNKEFSEANLEANKHWLKFFPVIEGFSRLLTIIIILVGGIFVIKGELTVGDIMAFSLLSWCISEPMRQLGVYINDIQRFFASSAKIIEIQNKRSRILSPENGRKQSDKISGKIEFRDVCYHYPYSKLNVLDHINLEIEPGSTVAVMGGTGSGKTTLINAITRLIDTTSGKVFVDGTDVRQWDLYDLRKQIAVATQDVMLYSDTIDSNIAFSDPDRMTFDDVKMYAGLSAADEFIDELPDKYDTIIGERGTGLSGGQKQRIALARALATKPAILILDDTTSALDTKTEVRIRQNLNSLSYSCTKIIIAQRIGSVKHADKIIIMDSGRITESGTHDELIKLKGYYYGICKLQGVIEKDGE